MINDVWFFFFYISVPYLNLQILLLIRYRVILFNMINVVFFLQSSLIYWFWLGYVLYLVFCNYIIVWYGLMQYIWLHVIIISVTKCIYGLNTAKTVLSLLLGCYISMIWYLMAWFGGSFCIIESFKTGQHKQLMCW